MSCKEEIGSKIITIRSNDQVSGSSSSSNFNVQLTGFPSIKEYVKLKEVTIPLTYYNINSTNNWIDFHDGTSSLSAQVTAGNYTMATLVTAVQAAMNSVSSNFVVSYSALSYFVSITHTASTVNLLFASGTHKTTSMAQILGYTATDTGAALTQTGTKAAGLWYPLAFYISISQVGNQNYTSNKTPYTFRIPIGADTGNIFTFSSGGYYEQECRLLSQQSLFNVNILLTDGNGNLFDINNAPWEMVLEVR